MALRTTTKTVIKFWIPQKMLMKMANRWWFITGLKRDSIFDKTRGFERGLSTYINKEKALNYLHHSALHAVALRSSRLVSAAKIIKDFQNPSVGGEIRFRSVDNLRERYDKMV